MHVLQMRLVLAFVFTLWGWTITLGALARTTPMPETGVAASVPADATPPKETAATEAETKDVAA